MIAHAAIENRWLPEPSARCGLRSNAFQTDPIVDPVTPDDSAIVASDQCVAFSGVALDFIHGDRVISTLRETLEYLDHSGSDDRQTVGLLDELVNVVHTCLWGQFADGAEAPDPEDEDFRAVSAPRMFKTDDIYSAGEPTWVDYIKNRAEPRLVDPNSFPGPAVARLVEILRSDEPAIQGVTRAASACLLGPGSPAEEDHHLSARLSSFAQQDEVAPMAMNTVSPVRYYADYAGRVFQQLMTVVRQSFPGIPEPSWVWQPG